MDEIAETSGFKNPKQFCRWAYMSPWLKLTPNSKSLFTFKIDRSLRAICEGRTPPPSAEMQAVIVSIGDLRKEIDRRREEACARRAGGKWNPAAAHTGKLRELIDYIEEELDRLTQ